jgi:hypothetical protein
MGSSLPLLQRTQARASDDYFLMLEQEHSLLYPPRPPRVELFQRLCANPRVPPHAVKVRHQV